MSSGVSLLSKLYPQLIWGCVDLIIILSILCFKKEKSKSYIGEIILGILIAFSLVKGIKSDQASIISPKTEYGRIKENYLAIGQVFTKILPMELFKLQTVPSYLHEKPNKRETEPRIKNIIFIVGESETSKHVSTFGYPRKTTPFMDYLSLKENSIIKETYSAGTLTILSLPSLFNAIPYPNGNLQIESGNTNLFNLAKEQRFKTYFYSSQAENQMNMISLLGARWIDDLRFPTNWGYSASENMPDFNLLDEFYKINLNNDYNFVILHQRASHLPYGELLSEKDHIFGNERMTDKYDNTIYKTDLFIKTVYEYLKSTNKEDWLLIYTSDHGQIANEEMINQGNYFPDNYTVPLLIYSPNIEVSNELKRIFSTCSKATHQQLATTIINILGYNMDIADCKTAYINGDLLSGELGHYKITQPENKLEYIKVNSSDEK